MTDNVIEFKNFSFKYDAQSEPTLKNINLSIKRGEKVLIVGPSGSGKSTLGQCLNGIIPHIHQGEHEGEFLIDGKPAFDLSIYDKSHLVSTVLQDTDGQFIGLSVAEDLAFALENDVVSQKEMRDKVNFWAKHLDLTPLLHHRPQDLSGGQKQRVSLAGVLIDESPILLFDEPLANLDPKSGQDTIALIDDIHQSTGGTTIIIEHRLEDVIYRKVDRIILINDGSILFNGSVNELLKTNLLNENGIREPLYISVLRSLGYPFEEELHLDQLHRLDLPTYTLSGETSTLEKEQSDVVLEVMGWQFAYRKENPILKDINLSVYKGEKIALVGKNGAGKSTFAKSLCQFVQAEGQIFYKGKNIADDSMTERASRIGYVLQNPNQMISQTMIFDEVALGLRLRGIEEEVIKEKVYETLKVCGLYAFRNWPISALSYGQKKRVSIASILVLNPEIIILDEPTAGQDQKNYTDLMNFLNSLQEKGHTIIMITHDMQLMLEYSDRAIVLAEGRILADASPLEVLNQPAVLEQANLKPTSLFALAQKIGEDPEQVTDYYIKTRGDNDATI